MAGDTPLTPEQLDRYSRQITMPEIGMVGQRKLLASSVLVIGVGGLGSPAAIYLAAAGVGRIGLADGDVVQRGNLNRQILHTTADIDELKVNSAAAKLHALNPGTTIATYAQRVTAETLPTLLAEYDFAIDATDSHESRRLVNQAACTARTSYTFAGVHRLSGMAMTVIPGHGACYECAFSPRNVETDEFAKPAETAAPVSTHTGILGVVPGLLGTIQAAEAIKFLLGHGDLLANRLLTVNLSTMTFHTFAIRRQTQCPTCRLL